MRQRLGWWVVVVSLAAGCAAPRAQPAVATDQTDVWFMQHMVPYLRQTTVVVSLARAHLTDPGLARLADTVNRGSLAGIEQLQEWLDQRGLSPHGHSHQPVDSRRQTDLERLARLRGGALDLAFVQVMTARSHRASKPAATEARDGRLPPVRQLARRMVVEHRVQVRQLKSWRPARQIRPGLQAGRGSRSRHRGPLYDGHSLSPAGARDDRPTARSKDLTGG